VSSNDPDTVALLTRSIDRSLRIGAGSPSLRHSQAPCSTSYMVQFVACSLTNDLGRIYDSHSSNVLNRCHDGQACYASAFVVTLISAVIALVLALQLHSRRTKLQNELPYLD
jgi:hypothetical protein